VKQDVEKDHIVLQGGLRLNEQVNTADSWGSYLATPVQANWTINPPSTKTIIDRNMKVRCFFEITGDQTLQLGLNDALRQFPIASIMDVLTVQINGETISDNMADKIHAMLCYGNNGVTRNGDTSTSPSMPDMYQEYGDYETYGTGKNALSDYGEQSIEEGRGGFPVAPVGTGGTSFRVEITEPLFLSPFLNGLHVSDEGFVNVNQMNINMRWKQNISQIMSHASGTQTSLPLTNIQVTMYRAPEILTTFITPDLTQPIPELQVLPYTKTQEYIKQMGTVTAGSTANVVSDSIKLSQVPRKMYLFARHNRATSTFSTADSYLALENLSVLWNNQSGLFSSATPQDLYRISKENGLNLSWAQFSKYRGSVFCCEFGKDVGLLDSEAPGCQGQYTIQVQATLKNQSTASFDAEFFMVIQNEGTFSISPNFARASLGNLNQQMVLMAKQSPELHHMTYRDLQGAGFFSGLKNIVNKIARGVQRVADSPFVHKVVGTLAPEFEPALGAVSTLASGARKVTGGAVSGGKLKRLSRR
jgi:hypothetical protein